MYTKGKWKIVNEDGDFLLYAGTTVIGEVIREEPKEDIANCRLIAAAPDLLEACKKAYDYLEEDTSNALALEDHVLMNHAHPLKVLLGIAIEKATGE